MPLALSEAIRLGSLIVSDPRAGDIDRCAITMALKANGELCEEDQDYEECEDEYDYENTGQLEAVNEAVLRTLRPQEAVSARWMYALKSHEVLNSIYPWLQRSFGCPWCGRKLTGTEVVHHPFDAHVMTGQTSIDQLCSWIASVEPSPYERPQQGETFNLGLGVHFSNADEKQAVLWAAAEAELTPSDFVAAAVRMAIRNRLSVAGFQRPAPEIGPGQNVNFAPYMRQSSREKRVAEAVVSLPFALVP
jgi:hypothetical protein